LVWFVALNVLRLVLISAFVWLEEILGLFAAALGATGAEAVREQGLAGFRPRARWLWRTRGLPWRAVRESGLVLVAPARRGDVHASHHQSDRTGPRRAAG
jgi:UPF0716 family protein affecting phage T7 exclusion